MNRRKILAFMTVGLSSLLICTKGKAKNDTDKKIAEKEIGWVITDIHGNMTLFNNNIKYKQQGNYYIHYNHVFQVNNEESTAYDMACFLIKVFPQYYPNCTPFPVYAKV